MRVPAILVALALVPSAAFAAPAERLAPAAFDRASAAVVALADAVQDSPGASPALAVVLVRRNGAPVIWVDGEVEPGGAAAGPDTPFYIASMTKAYVGLLAAEMDRRAVLPLDTRLDAVWPDLSIAAAPDAGAVTLQDLLGHRMPFANEPLSYRTSYVDRPPVSDYRRLLETASEPRGATFQYTNLGYLLYGAALELKTGRDWRDALAEEVTGPLGLTRTTAFSSRLAPGTAAGGAQRTPDGWSPAPLKPDALMHAAGGLVASPADMARWLQAHLRGGLGRGPSRKAFARARTPVSTQSGAFEGVPCHAYALGWHLCTIAGVEVHMHGGGYTGVRSSMAWSDELGVGVAVLSNSDSMTGALSARLAKEFVSLLADPAYRAPDPAAFAAEHAGRVDGLVAARVKAVADRRARPEWRGWSWRPAPTELDAYVGVYRHPAFGTLEIMREGDGVALRFGEMRLALEPASRDLFGGTAGPLDAADPVWFERDAAGRPTTLAWNDLRFVRAD